VEPAHLSVATRGEQRRRVRVGGQRDLMHASRALLTDPLLGPLDEPRPEPTSLRLRMDDADCKAELVMSFPPAEGDELPVLLEDPGILGEVDTAQPLAQVGHADARAPPEELLLVCAHQVEHLVEVVRCRRSHAHAGASESRASASPVSECSSTSGCGSGSSPSRLIHTVGSPSSVAGATSWYRLAATCTCASSRPPICSS